MIGLMLVSGGNSLAVDAVDVTFDDTSTTTIQGSNVQAALESADTAITDLVGQHSGIDPNAAVVHLRVDCDNPALPNCFETMDALSNLSTGWIWNTRNPSASAPLLVDIGPGEFGQFFCDSGGYVTLRGAGREQSILKASGTGSLDGSAVHINNGCDELSFIDLGIHGTWSGVHWKGDGSASWSNVDIVGIDDATYAWFDRDTTFLGGPEEPAIHYLHGSRVRMTLSDQVCCSGGSAFYNLGSEIWFFGGDIQLTLYGWADPRAVVVAFDGDFRAFGTVIRVAILGVEGGSNSQAVGVKLFAGGIFHAHGSIINVFSDGVGDDLDVIGLDSAGFAHTPGTAFVLTPGGVGSATRVATSGSGTALSPFSWPAGTAPPDITSQHGSDSFVETDCNATDCTSSGTDPHLMLYSDSCTGAGGPWFDVVRGSCRD